MRALDEKIEEQKRICLQQISALKSICPGATESLHWHLERLARMEGVLDGLIYAKHLIREGATS